MLGQAFEKCVGCSSKVVEAYKENKHEFIIRACNEPDFLEELTGITAMMANINIDDIECFDFDEDMND
jgi:ubiquitin-like modifier-activating enzyme ATG7